MAVCTVCKSSNCPCHVCHGNPKKFLGGIHAGKADHRTGAVTCPECKRKSSRA